MLDDGMMLDHMRTTGLIFRRGLVAKSKAPVTLWVDDPVTVGDYAGLMRGKYNYLPGWQDIHSIRKAFGPVPPEQATAPWMTQSPPNPVVSDTGQIIKDIDRKQLTVAAPEAEAFSGLLDGKALAGLQHLGLDGASGFATVVVVAADDKNLAASSHLIISRTGLDSNNVDSAAPVVQLTGMKPASDDLHWYFQLTRPRADVAKIKSSGGQEYMILKLAADGHIELPHVDWHECELWLRK
jgi:hypothetical protein